jgi:hypothetical protein
MAHNSTLVQSGEDIFIVAEDGGSLELTPPSTVVFTDGRPPRFEVNKVHAIMVNSVDKPLIVDDAGIVLFFSPPAPTAAPTVAVGAAGALTGTYGVKYTFAIRDLAGNTVAESGFSASASVALTSDKLATSNLQLMPGLTAADYDDRYDVVRKLYRTAAGGSTYFFWHTVADNTTTTYEGDESDASIAAIAADSLATVPFLSLIASFHDRMYGVDDSTDRDRLLYSEAGLRWAWPTDNFFQMPQVKGDAQSGITALLPRRDVLGITKSNMLLQLTGTDDSDFRLTILSTTTGCVSNESAASYDDKWYFLGHDGVYRWGEDGLKCVSDGRVRTWFTTDTFFNRDMFTSAFGIVDVIDKSYKLFLAPAGSEEFTQWVEFDIDSGTWWGPHETSAYGLTSTIHLGSHSPLIGFGTDDGFITVDTDTRSDHMDTAIEVEAITTPIKANDPPAMAYFGTLSLEIEPQAAGTLSIYPIVGELNEAEDTAFSHDLTDQSTGLGRLGYGRFLKLRFYHNTIEQIIQLLGFEVDPVNTVGRRE